MPKVLEGPPASISDEPQDAAPPYEAPEMTEREIRDETRRAERLVPQWLEKESPQSARELVAHRDGEPLSSVAIYYAIWNLIDQHMIEFTEHRKLQRVM